MFIQRAMSIPDSRVWGGGKVQQMREKKYDKYLEVKQWQHGEGAVKKSGRTGYVIYGWTPQNRRHLWKTPKILRLWSWRRYLLSSPNPRSIDRIKFNVSIGFVIATPKVLVEIYRSIIFRKSLFFWMEHVFFHKKQAFLLTICGHSRCCPNAELFSLKNNETVWIFFVNFYCLTWKIKKK